MSEILEYLIRLRGAEAAAAQMRGLSGEMDSLAASERRVGASGAAAAAGTARMEASMGLLRKTATVAAGALLGVGFEAVKMSTNFNHEMLRIRTDAGASNKELAFMKGAVLDLAASGKSMGAGPQSLAQGLYHVESLGLRGKAALHALTLASQESAISGANLEQTTSALGAAMFIGIKGAGGLDQIMALLNATVGTGNMRMQQLIESLGTGVLGSFKTAHMSIQDVSAALAVLTDGGYQASSGAAQLSTALHFLYNPSTKAQNALQSVGLTGRQLGADLMQPQGLLVALKDLHTHLSGLSALDQEQLLGNILPGGRGRVLLQLYQQIDRLQQKYSGQAAITGQFKGSVRQQGQDPTTQLKMQEAALQAAMIRLGNTLLPIVVPALKALATFAVRVVNAFKDVVNWFKHGGTAAQVLGKILIGLGAVMVTVFAVNRVVRFGQAFIDAAKNIGGAARSLSNLSVRQREAKTAADASTLAHDAESAAFGGVSGAATRMGVALRSTITDFALLRSAGLSLIPVLAQVALAQVTGGQAGGGVNQHGSNAPSGSLSNLNIGSGGRGGSGINLPLIGNVPLPFGLGATGAIVTKATRAVIGEAGPEAVVPLSRMPGAQPLAQLQPMSGGMTVNATFSHPIVIDGREVARAYRRETIKAMAAGA